MADSNPDGMADEATPSAQPVDNQAISYEGDAASFLPFSHRVQHLLLL